MNVWMENRQEHVRMLMNVIIMKGNQKKSKAVSFPVQTSVLKMKKNALEMVIEFAMIIMEMVVLNGAL